MSRLVGRALRTAKRIVFLLFFPVLFLLVLETVVRLSGSVEREGYGLGNVGTARWFTFRTNAEGFRDEAFPEAKGRKEYRVLFVGDSFTFGQGVARSGTFPRLLEQRWRSEPLVAGKTVRVINGSKLGWNILEEAAFVEHRAPGLSPDLIVLVTIPNDGEAGATEEHFHDRWITRSLLWRSHLVRWLYIRWLWISLEVLHPERNLIAHLNDLWAPGSPSLTRYQEGVAAIANAARRLHVPLLQVAFPMFHKLQDGYPLSAFHEEARRIAADHDIPFLDLLTSYRGRSPRSLSVSATDVHPNETAHAIAADAIDPFVRAHVSGGQTSTR